MNIYSRNVLLCLCLCFAFRTAGAQYSFKAWTADTGLPQNTVNDILRSRDGYIWLTTFDGLVRFDGFHFTVFNKQNSEGISSNRFMRIFEDAQGDLWTNTEDGGVVRVHAGSFSSYGQDEGLTSLDTTYLTGDARGNPLVFEVNGDIMRWDGRKFQLVDQTNSVPAQDSPPQTYNRRTACPLRNDGLYCAHALPVPGWKHIDGLPSLRITADSGIEDIHGTLWLASDRGLVRVGSAGDTKVYTERDGLPGKPIALAAEERLILFSVDRKGSLWQTDIETWQHKLITASIPETLTDPDLVTAYADREGNLWFGTNRSGLLRATRQTIATYSVAQGPTQNNVYPIFQDSRGFVWVGTTEGLFSYSDGHFSYEPSLGNGIITAIGEDRTGRLLIARYNEVWVKEGERFNLLYRIDGGVFWTIYQDLDGTYWFGWSYGLVHYVDGVAKIYTTNDGLAGNDVKVILPDPLGGFWIGTYGGLSHFVGGRFTSWREQNGLPGRTVRSLYEDGDGVLWVGTYDSGLGRFKDGHFTRYTINEGLFNDGVFQILPDDRGNFWMTSNRGIYRVSRRELDDFAAGRASAINSVAYGKPDGMLSVECNGGRWPAGVRTRDGRLWFPTENGIAVVAPEQVTINLQPPPVMIESFQVDHVPVAIDREVEVEPQQESFEISYTALSFVNSENVRFRYRLEGIDQKWIEAGTRRTAYYSHVPAGAYKFHVIAANSDGIWNTTGMTVRINIRPRFYRTWWFVSVICATLLGIAFAQYRRRVNRLERARAAQEEFSRKLLASQEEERQRIAAALHDTLGQSLLIIKNRVALALADTEERETVEEQLTELSHSAASAIEECREIAYNLRPYQIERFGLTQTLRAIFLRIGEVTTIEVTTDIDDADDVLVAEAQTSLYRVVQECVNNIIKHSGAQRAGLSVKRTAGSIIVLVEDDGHGFAPRQEDVHTNGHGPSEQSGFGLIGIAERVKMLGGTFEVASGQGTRIRITIPTHIESAART